MSRQSIAHRLTEAVHWRDDPSHVILLSTPQYNVLIGDLPPHDKTRLHTHTYPTICLALITTHGIRNWVLSDPVLANQQPSPISIPQGAMLTYSCTPDNPHIHEYYSSGYRSLFLVVESPLARVTGAPAPQMAIDVLPRVTVCHAMEDIPFASAATLTVPEGCSVRLHVNASDGDKLLIRLLISLEGSPLHLLDIRTPPDGSVERLQYDKCDPPAEVYVLSGFSNTPSTDEYTTITNTTKQQTKIVVMDYFATENVANASPQ